MAKKIKYPEITNWNYGPTLGCGPFARPTYPHPDSPIGRALQKRGEGHQYELFAEVKIVLA